MWFQEVLPLHSFSLFSFPEAISVYCEFSFFRTYYFWKAFWNILCIWSSVNVLLHWLKLKVWNLAFLMQCGRGKMLKQYFLERKKNTKPNKNLSQNKPTTKLRLWDVFSTIPQSLLFPINCIYASMLQKTKTNQLKPSRSSTYFCNNWFLFIHWRHYPTAVSIFVIARKSAMHCSRVNTFWACCTFLFGLQKGSSSYAKACTQLLAWKGNTWRKEAVLAFSPQRNMLS